MEHNSTIALESIVNLCKMFKIFFGNVCIQGIVSEETMDEFEDIEQWINQRNLNIKQMHMEQWMDWLN